MAQQLLTPAQFCADLPRWYDESTRNEYWAGWRELLNRLPSKAAERGYFEMGDLRDIADWGGNQHGVKQRLQSSNTPEHVKRATQLAIRHLDDPARAIRAIVGVRHWGIAYGSKTLTFMRPADYCVLDSWIRKALALIIPAIADGNTGSVVKGYVQYLDFCRELRDHVSQSPPVATASGRWRIAEVGQALFEFARSGGVLLPR